MLDEEHDPSCWTFFDLTQEQRSTIANHGSFVDGDTVTIIGAFESSSDCGGGPHYPDNSIQAWRDADFGCGVLSIDEEYGCGTVYSELWGVSLTLDSHGEFQRGARVNVRGTIEPGCYGLPECAGICIFNAFVTACADTVDPVDQVSWGRIKSRYR